MRHASEAVVSDQPNGTPRDVAAQEAEGPARPAGRWRIRPVPLVLQAGAIAAALASIIALVVGVLHLVDGGDDKGAAQVTREARGPHSPLGKLSLSLPRDALHRVPDGVTVDVRLRGPGYPEGSKFFVTYKVVRVRAKEEKTVGTYKDKVRFDVDSDKCTCLSTPIPVPSTSDFYRVDVSILPVGSAAGQPAESAHTRRFRGRVT